MVRSGTAALWAFTDKDGRATLEGLAAGSSRLAVIALPYPGMEVEIGASTNEREIVLAAAINPLPLLADIPRSRLAGRISASLAESLAGYEVLLLPVTAPEELGGVVPRLCDCDASGEFEFEGLAHGAYSLKVLPPWASGGSWPDLCAPSNRDLNFKGPLDELSIELAQGTIEGEVHDDLGRALAGALVLVNEVGNDGHVWPPASSGPDGRFKVSDIPPGKYRVTCRAGEGGSSIDSLEVANAASAWAAMPTFSARKQL